MSVKEVLVPDIGNFKDVEIIEIAVKPGDTLAVDDPILTVESDKAAMDIPAPFAGVVKSLQVRVGDKVSQGTPILMLEAGAGASDAARPAADVSAAPRVEPPPPTRPVPEVPAPIQPQNRPDPVAHAPVQHAARLAHASPAVRRFARDLGADLAHVRGSGPKGRIRKEDVQTWIKAELAKPRAEAMGGGAAGLGLAILPAPVIDFAQFGGFDTQPLSRIKKLSGANLHRNWVTAPHVTQFDEADITDLEDFRKSMLDDAAKKGVKLTLLAFLMKAVVNALRTYPSFNASLAPDGENLILKKYFHIGFACDTPDGLVVPVIRDVNRKDVLDIARELGELSARARERKLKVDEMQGGCFTISSLGGIGGTAFTPIINCPEVAILGLSRAEYKPVWNKAHKNFEPRLVLPLSLSYDHRVIDGADGARFTSHMRLMLSDVRRLLL